LTTSIRKRFHIRVIVPSQEKGLLLGGLALLSVAVMIVPWPWGPLPTTRHFALKSRQFQFEPSALRVNRGDRVILTLTASDVVHGLYLDSYGIRMRAEPGRSQTVSFMAMQTGKFRFRCSVSCGTLHPFMIGELIVAPNTAWGRTVALLLLVVGGTLIYLWRFPPGEPGQTSS
jgi:heme/copper-type cytochrome/quinol oxidase subunit 2